MKKSALLCALAFTACFILLQPSWSIAQELADEAGEAVPSVETAKRVARSLVDQGRFDEALEILRPLQRALANEPQVVFLRGLAASGAARDPALAEEDRHALLDEAITAFRAMLIDRPELVRVRLELALAFFLKGEDDLARTHFEHVLAGEPPSAVVANVRSILSQIRARRRWTLHAGVALAPDTNIGAGSEERTIVIGGLPFQRDQQELTTSGIGLSVWASGEYQYPLTDRHRLRAGAFASRRDYPGSQFDGMFVAGHAGPRWLWSARSETSLLASVQRSWFGNTPNFDALGARIEAGRILTQRLRATVRADWHERQFRTQTHLDGPVMNVTLDGSWVATPTIRADIGLGWGRERPDPQRWRHERRWLRAGAEVALPRGFNLGANVEQRWTDYEGNWSPFVVTGGPREDRTRSVRLFLHNRRLVWNGFSPQLSLVHEVRETNAQAYDYRRTGGELRAVRLF